MQPVGDPCAGVARGIQSLPDSRPEKRNVMRSRRLMLPIAILFFGASGALAQQAQQPQPRPAPPPPPLFFKEAWKATPQGGQHPVTPDSLASPNLELKLYGDGPNVLMNERNPPFHLFTGA